MIDCKFNCCYSYQGFALSLGYRWNWNLLFKNCIFDFCGAIKVMVEDDYSMILLNWYIANLNLTADFYNSTKLFFVEKMLVELL